ncbi:MAG: hydrogenase formation protein HypD, partial [archaeon GB-1867-035]|nr:hydrogenase formation protein HypD [Candidatus Culexmicrobium profundum]
RAPMVVAGFEPIDVLLGVAMLIKMINTGIFDVKNEYTRVVREEGNVKAIEVMYKVFEVCDAYWRGIGFVPNSGLKLRNEFEEYDATKRFDVKVDESYSMPPGCKCGEVLRGLLTPSECPLFGKACTPLNPVGPCMVSSEGSCAIVYKYGRKFKV